MQVHINRKVVYKLGTLITFLAALYFIAPLCYILGKNGHSLSLSECKSHIVSNFTKAAKINCRANPTHTSQNFAQAYNEWLCFVWALQTMSVVNQLFCVRYYICLRSACPVTLQDTFGSYFCTVVIIAA